MDGDYTSVPNSTTSAGDLHPDYDPARRSSPRATGTSGGSDGGRHRAAPTTADANPDGGTPTPRPTTPAVTRPDRPGGRRARPATPSRPPVAVLSLAQATALCANQLAIPDPLTRPGSGRRLHASASWRPSRTPRRPNAGPRAGISPASDPPPTPAAQAQCVAAPVHLRPNPRRAGRAHWRAQRVVTPSRAPRVAALGAGSDQREEAGGLERPVGQHDVGAGPADRGERLEDRGSRSIQPLAAAASTMAYSPEMLYAATGTSTASRTRRTTSR